MSEIPLEETLDPQLATQMWQALSAQAEQFVAAWEAQSDNPPDVRRHLPDAPAGMRVLALVELIKVDLAYRWKHACPKRLEDYFNEFPELVDTNGSCPCDLIYEEYQVRRQAGEKVDSQQYLERFPTQSDELKRLLQNQRHEATSSLLKSESLEAVDFGERIDDFDLLTILGKGAFAQVFLARQRSMQRMVALKISSSPSDEPQTMAQLDHPHIVRVFDQRVLAERKLRLLYMQYIPGGTLQGVVARVRQTPRDQRSGQILLEEVDAALKERGEEPPSDSINRRRLRNSSWAEVVCWLGARLASALDYAHRRNVLHRDVKPANVLLAADASPKLADFNVSFSSELEGATAASYFGGSLAYMSPEQLEAANPCNQRAADDVDARADIYSLGILLWELLTGARPFRDEQLIGGWLQTINRMTEQRRAGLPSTARAALPSDCPPGLEQVLMRSLAPNRDDRYATAGEFSRQLQLCLQPGVQRLFRPAQGTLRAWAANWPTLTLVAAGVLPNVLASALNIIYNWNAIIGKLTPDEQEFFQRVQLVTVNGVAFPLGIAVILYLIWPVLRAANRIRGGGVEPLDRLIWLRKRCLFFGDTVALVILALWTVTGFIFPVWIRMKVGPDSVLQWEHYVHFAASQLLCGLMVSSLCFFIITFLAVRLVYPTLAQEVDPADTDAIDSLMRLGRRLWIYFGLAVSVPFLAVMMLVLINTDLRAAFAVLGVVGLVSFGAGFWLSRTIQSDLTALAIAGSPSDSLGTGTDSSDSFWSHSWR